VHPAGSNTALLLYVLQAQDYIHRIGRTGRAGAAGKALAMLVKNHPPDVQFAPALIKVRSS